MRQKGYYWVRRFKDGPRVIAKWLPELEVWWLIGRYQSFEDCDFFEIGPKVEDASEENAKLRRVLMEAPELHDEACALSPRDTDAKCNCWVSRKRAILAGG